MNSGFSVMLARAFLAGAGVAALAFLELVEVAEGPGNALQAHLNPCADHWSAGEDDDQMREIPDPRVPKPIANRMARGC